MNSTWRDKEHGRSTNGRQGYDEHVPDAYAHDSRPRGNRAHGGAQAAGFDAAYGQGFYNEDTETYEAAMFGEDDDDEDGYAAVAPGNWGAVGAGANGLRPGKPQRSLWRRVGLLLAGMLLVGAILAAVSLPSIEAALTLPPSALRSGPGPGPRLPATTVTANKGGTTPAPPPAKSTTVPVPKQPTAPSFLSQDQFNRPDQLTWGTASDGQRWGGDAMNVNVFSIAGHVGRIANGQGAFNATLGPTVTDAEVLFSGSINQFNQSNLGAVLRWTDTNDWYKAYIDGTRLILLRDMGGMMTRLTSVSFVAAPHTSYTLLFRVVGNKLAASVWHTGGAEPANWMVTATDNTFQNGLGGLRTFMGTGITVKITAFKETKITA